jgi:DNA repair exonuclease SbcCD ATPase subunit
VAAAETALLREREQRARREELARALATRRERVEELDRTRVEAGDRHTAVRAEADAAVEQAEATQTRLEESMRALTVLRKGAERARARQELTRLRTRMEAITRLRDEMRELRDARIRLPDVSAETLSALRELRDEAGAARARLEGASASVAIRAEQDLTLDGEALSAGSERTLRIDDDRDIDLGGIARITIHPGGGELPRLRDDLRDAEATLAERLEVLGVAGLREAEQALERRRELERELAGRQQDLEREAPDGIEALEQTLRETGARLGDPPDPSAPGGEDDRESVEEEAPVTAEVLAEAEQEEHRARDALETARARRDGVRERLQEAGTEVATLEARLADARSEQVEQQRQLEALADDEALAQRVAEAEAHWQTRVALREQARQEYQSLGGDDLELDAERAEKAHAQLRDQHRDNENEIVVLQDRLRSAGDAARHERVQELEADLEQARTALVRIEREAGAAARLYQVLDAAARAARERLTRPVIERIRPYLVDLFPGSEVWLGEDLDLVGLRGSDMEEPFDDLSGGAREQLSLLVRIGLAEVLGSSESWPLVLDDALVNTDPERIRRVQRLLYQASRRMQILLFTCHGPLFDELGPDRRVELSARIRS